MINNDVILTCPVAESWEVVVFFPFCDARLITDCMAAQS